jgi:hypothetical protein
LSFPSSSSSSSSLVSETSSPRSRVAYLSYCLFFLSSFAFLCTLFEARFATLTASLRGSSARCSVRVRSLCWRHPTQNQIGKAEQIN